MTTKKQPPGGRSNNKGGYTLKDEAATKRFGRYLADVIARAKARDVSMREISRRSSRADGTGSVSQQTISKLARGMHMPDAGTLKALARGLHGFTTYEKLLHAAGVEDHAIDIPLADKLRAEMSEEGVPRDIIEQTVAFLEFQMGEQAPRSRRRSA